MTKRESASQQDMNDCYRNGGDPVEDREYGFDCVWHHKQINQRTSWLHNELVEMGYYDDDLPMPWETWP